MSESLGWCRECNISLYLKPPVIDDGGDLSKICKECYESLSDGLKDKIQSCPTCGHLCDYVRSCGWCYSRVCDHCIDVYDHIVGVDCYCPDDDYSGIIDGR